MATLKNTQYQDLLEKLQDNNLTENQQADLKNEFVSRVDPSQQAFLEQQIAQDIDAQQQLQNNLDIQAKFDSSGAVKEPEPASDPNATPSTGDVNNAAQRGTFDASNADDVETAIDSAENGDVVTPELVADELELQHEIADRHQLENELRVAAEEAEAGAEIEGDSGDELGSEAEDEIQAVEDQARGIEPEHFDEPELEPKELDFENDHPNPEMQAGDEPDADATPSPSPGGSVAAEPEAEANSESAPAPAPEPESATEATQLNADTAKHFADVADSSSDGAASDAPEATGDAGGAPDPVAPPAASGGSPEPSVQSGAGSSMKASEPAADSSYETPTPKPKGA